MRTFIILVVSVAVLALAGCVPKPKKDYTVAQIASLDSLQELMRINAHAVDHLFSIRYQPKFTASQREAGERAGQQLMATSRVIRDRLSAKHPKRFAVLAGRLHDQARDLMLAAQADRDEDMTTALDDLRDTCKACHGAHR